MLEETHYYPFGLTMAGISSKAAGKLENRHKYNGIELNEDLAVNTYDAFYRNLDPQIGRYWEIDPKIEWQMENTSPYASNLNNPILLSDPKGDCPLCLVPILVGLLLTPQPANPPSSLPLAARTPEASANWDNANRMRDVGIVGSLLGGTGKMAVNVIDNTYQSMRRPSKDETKSMDLPVKQDSNVSLKGYNEELGLTKTTGRDFAKAAKETRDFAKKIDKEFVGNLKEEGKVTLEGLKQYKQQLEDAIKQFKEAKKDYSVQQARSETIDKVIKLWEKQK